jgi:hypothetical protein
MVSLTVAPVRAADLALPTDKKILEALKAKWLHCVTSTAGPNGVA